MTVDIIPALSDARVDITRTKHPEAFLSPTGWCVLPKYHLEKIQDPVIWLPGGGLFLSAKDLTATDEELLGRELLNIFEEGILCR